MLSPFTPQNSIFQSAQNEPSSVLNLHLLSELSHEVRAPLQGMQGIAQLLKENNDNPHQATLIDTLINAMDNLNDVVDDILQTSKLESGKEKIHNSAFVLKSSIQNIVDLYTPRALQKNIQLHCFYDTQLPLLLNGDASKLRRIMANLVSNAIKFTDNGNVSVFVSLIEHTQTETKVHFAVKDTGIGISADCQQYLFQPFSQLRTQAKQKCAGTGLGLYICKKLTMLMGGEITVKSELGTGSTFEFELTFVQHAEPQKVTDLHNLTRFMPLSSKKILVADDDEINLVIAQALLNRLGIEPDTVKNGEEALQAISEKDYDLMFLDLQMPILDGWETAKAIRSLDNTQKAGIPIIALSASYLDDFASQAIAQGMTDCISKPLDDNKIQEVVKKYLTEGQR